MPGQTRTSGRSTMIAISRTCLQSKAKLQRRLLTSSKPNSRRRKKHVSKRYLPGIPKHTRFTCVRINSREIPTRYRRITKPRSSFTCRRSRSTRILRWLMRGSPRCVRPFFIFMNRSTVGKIKPAWKRRLRCNCSGTWRKGTSLSANASTGWMKITTALWSNSILRLSYRRTMEILAG